MAESAASQDERTVELLVSRFDPTSDEKSRPRSYRVPRQPDWSVLDALNFVKDELDGSLSYRWSCRMAICGSCGVMIDGDAVAAATCAAADNG